jgi:hypothetical protein
MRRVVYTAVVFALAVGLPGSSSHGQEAGDLSKLMRRKLQSSQKVLEGIALNDFDKITDAATELQLVRKAVGWRVMKTPQCRGQEPRRGRPGLRRSDPDLCSLSQVRPGGPDDAPWPAVP